MKDTVYLTEKKRHKQSPCPRCGHRLDALTHAKLNVRPSPDWGPSEYSFSVCVYCAAMLRFKSAHELREADAQDLMEFAKHEPKVYAVFQKMVDTAKQAIRDRQRMNYGKN